ncbi:unnamed protein product [Prorocentrum cordatum]|uniref:Uncharacterized protein n=1 Tax=Prorocentrum cordatum TaxID=2364126 RepID=A0ABN9RAE6_9DINO|nr:unnamed protein product [Polarella glacialis]
MSGEAAKGALEPVVLRDLREVLDFVASGARIDVLQLNCEGDSRYAVLRSVLPRWDRWQIPLLHVESGMRTCPGSGRPRSAGASAARSKPRAARGPPGLGDRALRPAGRWLLTAPRST